MIGVESVDHVAVITLQRQAARNAIDGAMTAALEAALDRVEADALVRVVVLAADGPVFCAGADLKALARGEAAQMVTGRGGFAGLCARRRSKPLIAAVDGPAVGSGFEMVLACDLVVASTVASFSVPEVSRALIAPAGGLFRLQRLLPGKLAVELLLTGDPLPVERAHALGLVSIVSEPGLARADAVTLAQRIASNAPQAVQASLRVMNTIDRQGEELGWSMTQQAYDANIATDDFREGLSAFVGGRPPTWRGR